MKAILINNYGDSSVLEYKDIPALQVSDDKLLVKIYAASVNHLEVKITSGAMKGMMPLTFPWIPGYDFAGVVESVGKNVAGFRKGDKVYGNCQGGSYTEYLLANPATTVLMPEKLSFTEAASIPHVGETAWQGLFTHGNLKAAQRVLIHGAAGAVGAFAVQFAKNIGATVYANSSGEDREYIESLGADIIIDYKTQDFTTIAKDIDLVFDLVGGSTQEKSYQVLKKGGCLVSTVGISTQKEADKYGMKAIGMVIKQSGEDLKKISEFIRSGKLKWDVEMVLPLKDAKKGWDILQQRDPSLPKISHGKIVLEVTR